MTLKTHGEGIHMNNIERRDAQMVYISDETVMAEQKVSRRILQ